MRHHLLSPPLLLAGILLSGHAWAFDAAEASRYPSLDLYQPSADTLRVYSGVKCMSGQTCLLSGFQVAPMLSFPGSALVPTNTYDAAGSAQTKILATTGTRASPTTDLSAPLIVQKISNSGSRNINTAGYFSHIKKNNGPGTSVVGVLGEATDEAGGSQSSVIGVMGNALIYAGNGGASIGGSFSNYVQPSVSSYIASFGIETGTYSSKRDAPAVWINSNLVGGLLLGNAGTKRATAAIMTNPNFAVPFQDGLVFTPTSVAGAAVKVLGTTQFGIDLAEGGAAQTVSSVRMPNNARLTAVSANGTVNRELLRLDNADNARLGGDAKAVTVGSVGAPITVMGPLLTGNSAPTAPTVDARNAPCITIASGASAALSGVGGQWQVQNTSTFHTAQYVGDAVVGFALLGTAEWVASTTGPAPGKSSLAYNGSSVSIYNNTGASACYRVVSTVSR